MRASAEARVLERVEVTTPLTEIGAARAALDRSWPLIFIATESSKSCSLACVHSSCPPPGVCCVCVCVCNACTSVPCALVELEDNLREGVCCFHCVSSGNQA